MKETQTEEEIISAKKAAKVQLLLHVSLARIKKLVFYFEKRNYCEILLLESVDFPDFGNPAHPFYRALHEKPLRQFGVTNQTSFQVATKTGRKLLQLSR